MAIAPAMNSVAYHSPSLRPKNKGRGLSEDIADATDGVQELDVERTIDLVAQAAHEHVDNVRLGIERVLPHMRQNHRLRYDLPGVSHQVFEQRELTRAQID